MSLKSKIEAVIYASEEPVTLQQLVSLLAGEAQEELDELAAQQSALPLREAESEPGSDAVSTAITMLEAGTHEPQQEIAVPPVATAQDEISNRIAAEEAFESAATMEDTATPAPSPEDDASGSDNSAATSEAQTTGGDTEADKRQQREREKAVRDHVRRAVDALIRDYAESDRGIEIREVASGFRMGTKPEYHDAVRGFVKSLKPPLKLTLQALETLAVVAYKQPVTAAEISEIRGVDSAGVLGGLMTRKLIATAGRKQVIGRPMLYKTTRDFLLRFGLKDVHELPSMEEFERMAGELAEQEDLPMESADAIIENANARGDAEMIRDANTETADEDIAESPDQQTSSNDETAEAETPSVAEEQQDTTAESAAGGIHEEADQQASEPEDQRTGELQEQQAGRAKEQPEEAVTHRGE